VGYQVLAITILRCLVHAENFKKFFRVNQSELLHLPAIVTASQIGNGSGTPRRWLVGYRSVHRKVALFHNISDCRDAAIPT
jgi:hypothetical protein